MINIRSVRRHDIPAPLFGDVLPVLVALAEADDALRASRVVIDDLARRLCESA